MAIEQNTRDALVLGVNFTVAHVGKVLFAAPIPALSITIMDNSSGANPTPVLEVEIDPFYFRKDIDGLTNFSLTGRSIIRRDYVASTSTLMNMLLEEPEQLVLFAKGTRTNGTRPSCMAQDVLGFMTLPIDMATILGSSEGNSSASGSTGLASSSSQATSLLANSAIENSLFSSPPSGDAIHLSFAIQSDDYAPLAIFTGGLPSVEISLEYPDGKILTRMTVNPNLGGGSIGATLVVTKEEVGTLLEAMVLSYQANVELVLTVSLHVGDSDSVLSALLDDATANVTVVSSPVPTPCPFKGIASNSTNATSGDAADDKADAAEEDDAMTALLKALTIDVLSSSTHQLTLNVTYTGAVPTSAARAESTRLLVNLFTSAMKQGGFARLEGSYGGVKLLRATLAHNALSLQTCNSSSNSTDSEAPCLFAHVLLEFIDPVALSHLGTAFVSKPAKNICISIDGHIDWTGQVGGETFHFNVSLPITKASSGGSSRRLGDTSSYSSTGSTGSSSRSGSSYSSTGSSSRRKLSAFDFNDYLIGDVAPSMNGLSTSTFLLTATVENPFPLEVQINNLYFDVVLGDGRRFGRGRFLDTDGPMVLTEAPGRVTRTLIVDRNYYGEVNDLADYTSLLDELMSSTPPRLSVENGRTDLQVGAFQTVVLFHVGIIFDGPTPTPTAMPTFSPTDVPIAPTFSPTQPTNCGGNGNVGYAVAQAERRKWAKLCTGAGAPSAVAASWGPVRCFPSHYALSIKLLNLTGLPDLDTSPGYGNSDPYAALFLPSHCSPDECAAYSPSSACQTACFKTSTQTNKDWAVWGAANGGTFSALVGAGEDVRVRVYDEDDFATDDLLMSALLPSTWADDVAATVGAVKDYILVGETAGSSRAAVRVSYSCAHYVPGATASAAPTAAPTDAPTDAAGPTMVPTTAGPTMVPTMIPTMSPSSSPTTIPTSVPSYSRTVTPTSMPTGADCNDGVKGGTESDIDCGGGCDRCGTGEACLVNADCTSSICLGSGQCDTPVPTAVPADEPTAAPTAVPTSSPSATPTTPMDPPTATPTTSPTLAPTHLDECSGLQLTVVVLNVTDLPDLDSTYGLGISDPYVTVSITSACSDDECASLSPSSGCASACLKTSTQDNKEWAAWTSESKTITGCIPPTQTVAVRVYDEDTGFSDDQLLSADLPSDWAAAGPSDVAMAKEFVLADGGTGAQVALRIEFRCCP
jgi:hypothetical protein